METRPSLGHLEPQATQLAFFHKFGVQVHLEPYCGSLSTSRYIGQHFTYLLRSRYLYSRSQKVGRLLFSKPKPRGSENQHKSSQARIPTCLESILYCTILYCFTLSYTIFRFFGVYNKYILLRDLRLGAMSHSPAGPISGSDVTDSDPERNDKAGVSINSGSLI